MILSEQTSEELGQRHARLHEDAQQKPEICDEARLEHDAIAAEMVKRGEEQTHDSPLICRVPNYGAAYHGDSQCVKCIFSLPGNICGLYNFGYIPNYVCDSWHPFSELALQNPHGYLIWKGKQKAIATPEPIELGPHVITTDDEAFGIAYLGEAAQMNLEAFGSKSWADQHCILPRERRQYWPDVKKFYVYPVEKWIGFDPRYLIHEGKLVPWPQMSRKQKSIVRQSKDLPKQIPLIEGVVSVSESKEIFFEKGLQGNEDLRDLIEATFEEDVSFVDAPKPGAIPIYSLALVRDPRMFPISKKKVSQKQEEIIEIGENMPWEIEKRGDEYCVIKIDDGEVEGCHDTEGDAEDQLIALNIAESGGNDERAAATMPQPPDAPKLTLREKIHGAITELLDFFSKKESAAALPVDFNSDCGIAQKTVNGGVWHITWSSNAFRDRDGEIFTTQGLEKYVAQNEANEEKGFFNLWHINPEKTGLNTDFAVKKWQGVVGRFLVEAGPYLQDSRGQAAKDFFSKFPQGHPNIAPAGWGASVEFRYLPEERKQATFENFWIDKTSSLSRLSAANIWTDSRQNEVKQMALSEEQKQAFTTVFGEDALKDLVQQAERKTAELEQETDYKGADEEEQPAQPETATTADNQEATSQPEEQTAAPELQVNIDELAKSLAKQFEVNTTPILEELKGISEGMASLQERVAALEATKAIESRVETPRYTVALTRASEAQQTTIPAEEAAKLKPKETAPVGAADIWSQTFSG